MQLAHRSILLIVDGASTHALEEGFTPTNVNLHFFPSYTIAHLQPCDAGIIWSFKAHYKKIFCEDCIEAFNFYLESGDPPEELIIKDAIDFTASAWKKVTSRTIRNCWRKTAILPEGFLDELFPLEEPDQTDKSDITDEIQNLIMRLPLDQPIDAQEYVISDNNLITTKIPTDEEIIEAIKNRDCIEPEEEGSCKPISLAEALRFIHGILTFLEQ
ncbi:12186_t:CDS:2 [Gigaspora margarita]|uniref:12186_t:CDS:1 n=1 Tax=Gigaspora margarita TaxID=4874 RepID=A0ABN7WAM3_GIGMA|nr:12186_t:CDS:2 [Gigaspora margarita]